MKLKQFFQWSIKLPKVVTIKKNVKQLLIIGPLGINSMSYNTLDSKGDVAIKIKAHTLFFCSPSQSFLRVFSTLLTNKIYGVTRGYIIYLRISGIGYRCTLEKKNLNYKRLQNRGFKKKNQNESASQSDVGLLLKFSAATEKSIPSPIKPAEVMCGERSHTSKFKTFSSENIKPLENQVLRFKVGFSHDIFFQIPFSMKVFIIKPTIFCVYGIDKNQVTQIASKIRNIQSPEVYKGKGISFFDEVITLKQGKRK